MNRFWLKNFTSFAKKIFIFNKKIINRFFFIMILLSLSLQPSTENLVIVIMVKNEANVIVKTLQPYVDEGIQNYVILDTGSTDGTIDIAKQYFKENDIKNAHIFEQNFINFAASRNYALECAEHIFTQDCFLFMPDAEWYFQNVKGLVQFCKDQENNPASSFLVLLQNESKSLRFYVQRLFKAHHNIRFCGAVHETLNTISLTKVPDDSYILWAPNQRGIEKSRNRWQRDRDILLNELNKNPYGSRNSFYLAQTYDCLNNLEQAYHWYLYRTTLPGWDEENFMTYYRLAQICQRMDNWDEALKWYLTAYQTRPTRAEPLIKIAEYYWEEQKFALCYLFAMKAVQIPYPALDTLFIEKNAYDYTRYDILGRTAWYVQEYEVGKKAVEQALLASGDLPHLVRNLKIYSDQLNKK